MARLNLTPEQIERRSESATKHGGESALNAVQDGRLFVGLPAEAERGVLADLDELGIRGLIERGAVRLETCAVLYWNAVCKAADAGDLDKLDRYVARFGWLQGKALSAWTQAETLKGKGDGPSAADVLDAVKGKEK